MSAIDPELQALRENLYDMLSMVKGQLQKCVDAISNRDVELAQQIIDDEKKINMQELAIDRDSENILALFTPVATDLRSVLATINIANNLERIGDSAKSLARMLVEDVGKKEYKWIDALGIVQMLEALISMLKDMSLALRNEDTGPALRAARRDEELNKCFKKALKKTTSLIVKNPDQGKTILMLLLMVRNLERSGDLTKNIAEEIIFQLEARVIKHKKGLK
jgi:phosphate transport system protein